MTKQAGKQKVKDLVVPDGTHLAVTKTGDDADEAARKDALKRQVLAYDVARQEEERKMERAQRFGRGGPIDRSQRLDVGSRFNASREVKEPRKHGGAHEKQKSEEQFQDIAEKAKRQGGTSKGGWKGADALGINFEM